MEDRQWSKIQGDPEEVLLQVLRLFRGTLEIYKRTGTPL